MSVSKTNVDQSEGKQPLLQEIFSAHTQTEASKLEATGLWQKFNLASAKSTHDSFYAKGKLYVLRVGGRRRNEDILCAYHCLTTMSKYVEKNRFENGQKKVLKNPPSTVCRAASFFTVS
jgi:hypothetical protein